LNLNDAQDGKKKLSWGDWEKEGAEIKSKKNQAEKKNGGKGEGSPHRECMNNSSI